MALDLHIQAARPHEYHTFGEVCQKAVTASSRKGQPSQAAATPKLEYLFPLA